MQVAPAAGTRLRRGDITIIVYKPNEAQVTEQDTELVISGKISKNSVFVLEDFGDTEELRTGFKQWKHSGSLTHSLAGVDAARARRSHIRERSTYNYLYPGISH